MDKHVPKANPSPYAKRWWTENLSVLRKSYTRLRNQLRRRRRNREEYSPQLDTQAWVAKNVYFKAINVDHHVMHPPPPKNHQSSTKKGTVQ